MRYSLFLLVILFFSACSESTTLSDYSNAIPDIDPSEYLETYVQNEVIFQYGKLDEDTNVVDGWVITKNGELRFYSIGLEESFLFAEKVSRGALTEFYNILGEPVGSVDLATLKDMYAVNLISPRYELSDITPEGHIVEAYSSFVLSTQYTTWQGDGECPVHHDPFAKSNSFERPVLLMNDRYYNESPHSKKIYSWLKEVSVQLPLDNN